MGTTANVYDTIGAMFIGMVVGLVLWGFSCIQVWFYFDNYKSDPRVLRVLVFLTWLSDTIHQGLVVHIIYMYMVVHYGDFVRLNEVLWSVYVEVLFCAFTGFLVQCFFAYRIWQFNKNRILMGIIIVLIFAGLFTSIAYVCQGFAQSLNTYQELKQLRALSMTVNCLTALGDVVLSVSICWMLMASRTGFAWSNKLINRLVLFSINTGSLTALCACCSLLFILVLPNTFWYFAFYFVISRFYSNSLLATLNARRRLSRAGKAEKRKEKNLKEKNFGENSQDGPNNNESLTERIRSMMNQPQLGSRITTHTGTVTEIHVDVEVETTMDYAENDLVSSGLRVLETPDEEKAMSTSIPSSGLRAEIS